MPRPADRPMKSATGPRPAALAVIDPKLKESRCTPRFDKHSCCLVAACGMAATGAWAQVLPPPQNVVSLSASASMEVTKDWLTVVFSTTREGADRRRRAVAAAAGAGRCAGRGAQSGAPGPTGGADRRLLAVPALRTGQPEAARRAAGHRRLARQHRAGGRRPRHAGHRPAHRAHPDDVDCARGLFTVARGAREGRRRCLGTGHRALPRPRRRRVAPVWLQRLHRARGQRVVRTIRRARCSL